MRIAKLTDAVAGEILAARQRSDADGRARGRAHHRRRAAPAATRRFSSWARRLDSVRLTPQTLWVSARDRRAATQQVPRELRAALEHAARNIRRVAEQQRPRSVEHRRRAGRARRPARRRRSKRSAATSPAAVFRWFPRC